MAGTDAGFEHVGVDFERRQALALAVRLLEHQLRVLESLLDAALRAEIAGDHFRPLGVHHLRVGRSAPRDLKERGWIEPEPRREYQAFGEREPVEPEDQIDGELGASAVAGLPDVEALRKHRIEHGRDRLRDRRIAADEADAVALPDLLARARHRRLEEADALRDDTRGERGDTVRIAGAG